jgi:hypothetical protein
VLVVLPAPEILPHNFLKTRGYLLPKQPKASSNIESVHSKHFTKKGLKGKNE